MNTIGRQAGVAKGVYLTGAMALLSLADVGVLASVVVYLGEIDTYNYDALSAPTGPTGATGATGPTGPTGATAPPEPFPTSAAALSTLRVLNGVLIAIPLIIFALCAFDIAKLVIAPEKEITQRVLAGATGKKSLIKKRPLIFGSLFMVLSLFNVGVLVYTGLVVASMVAYFQQTSLPTDYPVSIDTLSVLSQIALYASIVPGLVLIFSLAMIFKAVNNRQTERAQAQAAQAAQAAVPPPPTS